MPFPVGSGAADPPARLLYDRAANYGSIIAWKYLKLHIQFSRVAGMKSSLYFTASSLASTIKICQTKNFAGSFVFSKSQRKWERPSARGKSDKEKPLLHGWDAFHVAAVLTVVIISFVFLISGDNLFLPLVRPV